MVQKKEGLHIISPSYTEYPVPTLWYAKQLRSSQTPSLGHQCPVQSSHTTLMSPLALHRLKVPHALPSPKQGCLFPCSPLGFLQLLNIFFRVWCSNQILKYKWGFARPDQCKVITTLIHKATHYIKLYHWDTNIYTVPLSSHHQFVVTSVNFLQFCYLASFSPVCI